MKLSIFFLCFLLFIAISKEVEEERTLNNADDTLNFIYEIRAGPDEEDKNFLVDNTRQNTYLFNYKKIDSNSNDDEIETNIEVNNLYMKNFEYKLIDNFLPINNNNGIYGVLGLGTLHGKNMFMDQLKNNKLIKKRKAYICLNDENSKKLKFQYELPKNYGEDFIFCPLVLYKDSYEQKYHESWMCEMTHILVKNEENGEKINKKIYLNDTYETMGKIVFNPNSNYITAPEIYLHYLKIQYSMNSRNRCSIYKRDDKMYLYCNYESQKNFDKLPYFGILIEGYLHKIPVRNLFVKTQEENNYMSLIRFDKRNNKGHLWEFGLPLFKSFVMQFDFDNKRVGFGEPLIKSENITGEWVQWYSLNEGLSPRLFANKTTMLIGLICFILIIFIIIIGGIIGYFSNYFKSKKKLYEETGQNIEMTKKDPSSSFKYDSHMKNEI
jgi:hypothetical protein